MQASAGSGISLYLPRSKSDRENLGKTYQTPALQRLCPVQAYIAWITEAALVRGPVFRGIDRWGHLSEEGLHANSVIPLLRQALERAGIPAEQYTSHSLRRGFATWAHQSGWDLKSLMSYVGWKDMKSAMRYVEANPFLGMTRIAEKPWRPRYRFLLLIQLANSENRSAASGLPMSHPSVEWVEFTPSTS